MSSPARRRDVLTLPKTDLHVHLEGSVRASTMAELADANGVPLPPGAVDLLEAGLAVTLNSDDPAMFGSPVAGEYVLARETFGISDDGLAAIARAGIQASFAERDDKRRMDEGVAAWLEAGAAHFG